MALFFVAAARIKTKLKSSHGRTLFFSATSTAKTDKAMTMRNKKDRVFSENDKNKDLLKTRETNGLHLIFSLADLVVQL
ncbi:unnamed protein product [Camellia sinensis]